MINLRTVTRVSNALILSLGLLSIPSYAAKMTVDSIDIAAIGNDSSVITITGISTNTSTLGAAVNCITTIGGTRTTSDSLRILAMLNLMQAAHSSGKAVRFNCSSELGLVGRVTLLP